MTRRYHYTITGVEWHDCTVHPGAHSGWVPVPIVRFGDEIPATLPSGRSRWGNRSAVDKPLDLQFG